MEKHHLSAFFTGLLFGLGLLWSGMANPAKVIGFLDITGNWDPSLAMVMAGAVAVGMIAFALGGKRTQSFFGEPMRLPTKRDIDKPLVLGSLGFGIGWGMAGFCPGPAVVAFGTLTPKALVFGVAMLAGMAMFELLQARKPA